MINYRSCVLKFTMNSKINSKFNLTPKKHFTVNKNKGFTELTPLTTLSPLDGRYSSHIESLRNFYSEAALIKYRTVVEIEWLKFLITSVIDEKELHKKYNLNSESEIRETVKKLDQIIRDFDIDDAKKVKEIEAKTNHDVKSVEYFIKGEMKNRDINESLHELVHFCCTSEDINNLAWGLIIKDSLDFVYHPKLTHLINIMAKMSEEHYNIPMMSRTHGQPATPTTVGKEIANYAYRLNEQHYILRGMKVKGKINGAVGNFNAHYTVLPKVNWIQHSQMFIEKIGLEWNPYTTQIENHDSICEIFNTTSLINSIMIGLCRDFWGYISLNYFKQKLKKDEVGSSTMPHKINPIDFENAEGNLGIANSMLLHMSSKLPVSRFQRDLSDSTVLRNIGSAVGYSVLAYNSLEKGLSKLEVNREVIAEELDNHWELLAEPLQTIMRYYGLQNPYELLKDLTRGKKFTQEAYLEFLGKVQLPEDVKADLRKLKPSNYLGNAEFMAKNIREFLK
jgi:adenylosuccinate lyase